MESFYELNWVVAQACVVFIATWSIKSFLIVPGLIFNPTYQWSETLYMGISAVEIGYIFYMSRLIDTCIDKGILEFQTDMNALLRKIETLEKENSEMRTVFRRVMVFAEDDKALFEQEKCNDRFVI